MWKIVLAIWGSAAIAISVAIYYTHDIRCLWFLLIPMCMSVRGSNKAESEDGGKSDVLEKIRAEIEALPKTYPFINHFDTYVKEDDVKKIIDKYRENEK